jgi:DNA-binding transcriptional LysR family regulator
MSNFEYYKIFYYAAQAKSFSKAAKILGNDQPNITRCMNNLESELNCRLFIRSHRGIKLTPEGENLYKHVAVAVEQLSSGENEIKENSKLETGLVTIGATETALHLSLLEKLEKFHDIYPHVRLRIMNHSTNQAIQTILSGLADFSVVTTPLDVGKQLAQDVFYSYREILICGPKFRDTAMEMHSLNDLRKMPYISLGTETCTRELYTGYFLSHGLTFEPDIEASTTDQILPMVQHNLGIGFYPEELAAPAIARKEVYQIRLFEPLPERKVCLIRDRLRPQNIASARLVDFILDKKTGA